MAVTGRGAFPLRSTLGGFSSHTALYRPETARKAIYNDFFFAGPSTVAYTADVAETVTLAEALAAAMSTAGSPSETVALSEALGALLAAEVTPTEELAIIEVINGIVPVWNPGRRYLLRRIKRRFF